MTDAVVISAVRTPVGKAPRGALHATRPDELAAVAIAAALRARAGARPGRDRRRHPGLRHARGRAGHERGAHRQPAGGGAGRERGGDRSTASAPPGCRPSPSPPSASACGSATDHRRRRHRVDEPDPDGRPQDRAEPGADARLPGRLPQHRPGGGEPRRGSRGSRARSRTPSPCAATSARSPRSTAGASRTRRYRFRCTRSTAAVGGNGRAPRVAETHLRPPTRARAATPRPRRWPGCGPPSTPAGSVTAGNSSQMSDGAAAVVVTSRPSGRRPLGLAAARRASWPSRRRGCKPELFGLGPVPAIRKVAEAGRPERSTTSTSWSSTRPSPRRRWRASRSCRSTRTVLNVNGGAIALGHPLGCTGAEADGDAAPRAAPPATAATAWSPCASAAAWAPPASSSEL